MEEYIKLEEEKARRRGKVYNWETAKYDKIWYDEDVHDLKSIETEFSAIVFNDGLSSEKTLSCEPTISFLNNNEIDFRISFDESDDEDYTVIFDKNSYFDDCDFLKDFEKEFTAIAYNDALTSKLDFLTEPTMTPQHIDEFDLKNETSLSECDEEEQNVLYFNDLFPFNVIYLDDSKPDKDNDDDKINISHSSGGPRWKEIDNVVERNGTGKITSNVTAPLRNKKTDIDSKRAKRKPKAAIPTTGIDTHIVTAVHLKAELFYPEPDYSLDFNSPQDSA
ncbi:hypothetical protein Tco_0216697 [Tanacetum coccineum]